MLVLGIESSCDETSAGVVEVQTRKVLSNVVASQDALHARFGGVVPEIASREHLRVLPSVVAEALERAGAGWKDLGGLAVTSGPGLAGSLLVGLSLAKAIALALEKPWVGVNHLEGHLLAAQLEHPDLDFPFLGLVVSGGHTSLYSVESQDARRLLARTRDDAVGEAFDKVAKLLDLGYPGGPALDKTASACAVPGVPFPKARLKDGEAGFSFSGLKTAVLLHLEARRASSEKPDVAAVARGFQEAAVGAIEKQVWRFAEETGLSSLVVGGGVAANSLLRQRLKQGAEQRGLRFYVPSPKLCMDNGAMIAYAGGLRLQAGQRSNWDLGVDPGWKY